MHFKVARAIHELSLQAIIISKPAINISRHDSSSPGPGRFLLLSSSAGNQQIPHYISAHHQPWQNQAEPGE
jgi:hypothetical protein